MEQTVISHPRLNVSVRTGAEGPKHDPYHYEETTFKTPRGVLIVHRGLGDWMTHNKIPIDMRGKTDRESNDCIQAHVKAVTGFTMTQIERIAERLHSRCRKCGGKQFHSEAGFPGEHFTICNNCGEVVGSYFCQSEIE